MSRHLTDIRPRNDKKALHSGSPIISNNNFQDGIQTIQNVM